jgi:NitT/TauT family transport system substrate-binding protein
VAAIVGEGMVSFLCSDPGIHTLADLKGRRVNVAGQGATPDFLLRKLLAWSGIDPDADLKLDYSLPYPEAAAALAAGKIECALLPEPFATMARTMKPSLLAPLDLGSLWTRATGQRSYPMTAFVVSKRAAASRPAEIKALLAAYEASISWAKAHPAEAGALAESLDLGLKASIAAKSIPLSAFVFETAETARPSVEAFLSALIEIAPASVGGRLPDDGFYASF